MDVAVGRLLEALAGAGAGALWVADEQVDAAAAARAAPGLRALTNRTDVAALLAGRGLEVSLSDFVIDGPLPAAGFRVAKEKALVHHVINRTLEHLPPGGCLWLAGHKQEGIRTYIDKAAARAGGGCRADRDGSAWLGAITRGAVLGPPLPDDDYPRLRPVALPDGLEVWSKPGIFGWRKRDAGSALLVEQLPARWPAAPARVLDLGCGYGYLTLMAARHWPSARFVATDNNVTAVAAAARNIEAAGIDGEAVAADCGDAVTGRFDALLCNPPFHQGFDVEDGLARRFLGAARRLLAPGGRALFVVNEFIPLERAAADFAGVRVCARAGGFKLVTLEQR